MKKLLLIAALAVGFGFAAKAQAPSSTSDNMDPNAPVMYFAVDTLDFGTITQGEQVDKDFTFVNKGKSPLIINDATAPCGCTKPTFNKEPVAGGKSGTVHVHFNSTGKMGMQYKTVTIKSNNGTGDVYVVLKGNVVAPSEGPKPGGPDNSRGGAPTNGQ